MARSSRYYPLALGGSPKDVGGRPWREGISVRLRLRTSNLRKFSFFIFSNFRTNSSIRARLSSHQRVGSLWFDFPLSPFSYFLFSTTSFCDFLFSFRLPLASVFYHRKPIWERESLKVSSPLRHFRSVSPDARQTALSRTPRFSAYLHIHSYNLKILSPFRERDR